MKGAPTEHMVVATSPRPTVDVIGDSKTRESCLCLCLCRLAEMASDEVEGSSAVIFDVEVNLTKAA